MSAEGIPHFRKFIRVFLLEPKADCPRTLILRLVFFRITMDQDKETKSEQLLLPKAL